jgi:hypothetical protein
VIGLDTLAGLLRVLPESFRAGGKETGLALVVGFGAAVAVSLLQVG